jgi:hypothetical protein
VKKVGEKRVKNRLPSPIYGLTFKGVMTYLSMQELTELESIGTQGESNEELKNAISEVAENVSENFRNYRAC